MKYLLFIIFIVPLSSAVEKGSSFNTSPRITGYHSINAGVSCLASGTRRGRSVADTSTSITEKKWLMQEIRYLQDNVPYYYKRNDEAASNMNFDNDYIFFAQDGKGTYHQTDGVLYPLTWHYKNKMENTIEFRISKFRDDRDLDLTWENIMFDKNTIMYTEYYRHATGIRSLGQGRRSSESCAQADSYVINGQ